MNQRGGAPAARGSAGMRLRGLMRKEFLQIFRDPSSIAIAFLMPLVLLLLFGYGVSLDSESIPLALVVEQPSADSASFTAAFQESRYFLPTRFPTTRAAEAAMMAGRVNAVVVLRQDFARNLRGAQGATIQLIVNGVDANTARIVAGYVEGVWGRWLAHIALARGQSLAMPVQIEQRVWYNSELRSRNFLVPGLVAIIMTLIGALLTAMVMAREWERGTMEALMVTPVSMSEVILGKLIPYFILGMGGLALSVAMAIWLFGVPLRGSLWLLFGASALFLLTALGMGLFISTLPRTSSSPGRSPSSRPSCPRSCCPDSFLISAECPASSRPSPMSLPPAITWPSCKRCFSPATPGAWYCRICSPWPCWLRSFSA